MGLLHFTNRMNNALFLISTYILNMLVVGSDCFWNWVVFVKYITHKKEKTCRHTFKSIIYTNIYLTFETVSNWLGFYFEFSIIRLIKLNYLINNNNSPFKTWSISAFYNKIKVIEVFLFQV